MSAWRQLFDEMSRVYTETARLLRDADGMLVDAGWAPNYGKQTNRVTVNGSDSMDDPGRWFPSWAVRYYRRKDDPKGAGPIIYVAVFLADEAGNADYAKGGRLEAPLVTAGVLRATKGDVRYGNTVCKWWFWTPGHALDGVARTVVLDNPAWASLGTCESFAVLLSELTSHEDVKLRVIDPLLRLVAPPPSKRKGLVAGV